MATSPTLRRQRGAALLIMMLVVLVAATAVLVTRMNSNEARVRQQTDAQSALSIARDALLDYAAIQPDLVAGSPAILPCPDIDDTGGLLEGEAHAAACGGAGVTVMGRLPWRTLGIGPPKDSSGACLWYVVSGNHKDAGSATAEMINPDANGLLRLYGIEAATVIAGGQPQDRPVAFVIAPMQGLNGQARAAATGAGRQCSPSFQAGEFLDADAISGISNAVVSGNPDEIDLFALAAGYDGAHNDRIAVISRADLATVVESRHDHNADMRALGLAMTECIADYARSNPGGSNDRRLPWPAPISMADYRVDTLYDDTNAGFLSGRLPDNVDDSNATTGNAIGQLFTDCNPVSVPAWTPAMLSAWRNWKDHFFYAVAESFTPNAPLPSTCATCLTVNGANQYSAVVIFSDARLTALSQTRDAPPTDADTKASANNYLEATNALNVPYTTGSVDFTALTASATFNDLLFCIDDALVVSEC